VTNDRDRLTKVLTLAMHPQTIPEDAMAAFRRARAIVRDNPSLTHPEPVLTERAAFVPETTFKTAIASVHPDGVLILVGSLSTRAYELELKYEVGFDFSQPLTAVKVTYRGPATACEAFSDHVEWAVQYINGRHRS
jgi:hypothetical protein